MASLMEVVQDFNQDYPLVFMVRLVALNYWGVLITLHYFYLG